MSNIWIYNHLRKCAYIDLEREREQHPKMTIGFKWKLNRFGFGRPLCDMSQVFTENKTSPNPHPLKVPKRGGGDPKNLTYN